MYRLPEKLDLNERVVRVIDDILFRKETENISKGARAFVFGNIAFLPAFGRKVEELTAKFSFSCFVLAGGLNPDYKDDSLEETRMVRGLAAAAGLDWERDVIGGSEAAVMERYVKKAAPDMRTMLETKSANTRENVVNAIRMGALEGAREVVLVATAERMFRARRTFEAHVPVSIPRIAVGVAPYYASIPGVGAYAMPGKWAENEMARKFVLGELKRLLHYADKGEYYLASFDVAKLRMLENAAAVKIIG